MSATANPTPCGVHDRTEQCDRAEAALTVVREGIGGLLDWLREADGYVHVSEVLYSLGRVLADMDQEVDA